MNAIIFAAGASALPGAEPARRLTIIGKPFQGFTRGFYTNDDCSSHSCLQHTRGVYGSTYEAWSVTPNSDSLASGQTKGNLILASSSYTITPHGIEGISHSKAPAMGVSLQRYAGWLTCR